MTDYSMVKPTKYAGITFRSRLEARWAVFFDALGISWEYEPETFVVDWYGESIQYTPDFRISCEVPVSSRLFANASDHDVRLFVEVKPTRDTVYLVGEKLASMVEYCGPCASGLLLLGPVPFMTIDSWPLHAVLRWHKGILLDYGQFFPGEFVLDNDAWGEHGYGSTNILPESIQIDGTTYTQRYSYSDWGPFAYDTRKAYDAARNARFGLGAAA